MDILFLISIALLIGYIGGKLSGLLKLPGVVGYILIGLILGPSFLNIFDMHIVESMGIVGDVALALVAFTIGSEMHSSTLKRQGAG